MDDEQQTNPVKDKLICNGLAVLIHENLYKALCNIQTYSCTISGNV